MKRIGRVIGLNAKDIPEYKRLHAALWPEIEILLREAGMRNYSIFLKEPENLLFAYLEYEGTNMEQDNLLIAASDDIKTLVGADRPDAAALGDAQTRRMVGSDGGGLPPRLAPRSSRLERRVYRALAPATAVLIQSSRLGGTRPRL